MSFTLIDSGWDGVIDRALRADHSHVHIICPFIKLRTAERLLKQGQPDAIKVITRFSLEDFSRGVSDTAALRLLLDAGAEIRGVRHLHAKLYLLGRSRAILTSANLTEAALLRNHEVGFTSDNPQIVRECRRYFEDIWGRAGVNLRTPQLDEWERRVEAVLATGTRPGVQDALEDLGADIGLPDESIEATDWIHSAEQAFVKFFGRAEDRVERSSNVFDVVDRSGCHWACTYPKNKRPRRVRDGAIMFMGQLVRSPNDVLIFGRAVGMAYHPERDDASDEELVRRDWKETWPHYIRVHSAEFLDASLSDGVSLNELMDRFAVDAFASTQRHAAAGSGNIEPRKSIRQQPDVQLTPESAGWLNAELERRFEQHGKLTPDQLTELDWPSTPLTR